MNAVRLARSLHARWHRMRASERQRLAEIAAHVKETALDARGAADREAAERDLQAANKQFAAAMLESAEADPELDDIDVSRLREDLRQELERISGAEIEVRRAGAEEPRS